MVVPIIEAATYGAAVGQSVREDVLKDADWAHAGGDEVIVIEKMGIFGAVTATYGMYKGREVLSGEGTACQATAFAGLETTVTFVNIVLPPNTSLRCFMTDSAADPAGLLFVIRGAVFKTWELG
jgi:hypothetical protein